MFWVILRIFFVQKIYYNKVRYNREGVRYKRMRENIQITKERKRALFVRCSEIRR